MLIKTVGITRAGYPDLAGFSSLEQKHCTNEVNGIPQGRLAD